jgi:hypothetical protein
MQCSPREPKIEGKIEGEDEVEVKIKDMEDKQRK